jgi:streptogramin lyase
MVKKIIFAFIPIILLPIGLIIGSGFLWKGYSQNSLPAQRKFQIKDGLADPIIKFLYQDKHGFVWINTHNGLQRFDGNRFLTWNSTGSSATGKIPSPILNFGITEDKSGNIWSVSEHEGPFCLLPDRKTIFPLPNLSNTMKRAHGILCTRNGIVLASTMGGLLQMEMVSPQKEIKYSALPFPADFPKNGPKSNLRTLLEDRSGRIWIATSEGFVLWNKEWQWNKHNPERFKLLAAVGTVSTAAMDQNGTIWYSNWESKLASPTSLSPQKNLRYLYAFQPERNQVDSFLMPTHQGKFDPFYSIPSSMATDALGRIWMSTLKGKIFCFQPKQEFWTVYDGIQWQNLVETSSHLTHLSIDRNNNLWIAAEAGLYLVPISQIPSSSSSSSPSKKNNVTQKKEANSVQKDFSQTAGWSTAFTSTIPQTLSTRAEFNLLLPQSDGTVYLNSLENGMFQWDPSTQNIQKINLLPQHPWKNHLTVWGESNSSLFISFWYDSTLYEWPKKTKQLKPLHPSKKDKKWKDFPALDFTLFLKNDSTMMVGNGRFLWLLKKTNGEWQPLLKKEQPTAFNRFVFFHQQLVGLDEQGKLWKETAPLSFSPLMELPFGSGPYPLCIWENYLVLGTRYKGLFLLDSNFHIRQNISTTDGLLHNTIRAIKPIRENQLWVETNQGVHLLGRRNPLLQQQNQTTPIDLILSPPMLNKRKNEFTTATCDAVGNWIVLQKNTLKVYPFPQKTPNPITPVRIGEILANGEPVVGSLSSSVTNIQFTLIADNLAESPFLEFRYRLLPTQENWTYAGNNNQIVFSSLNPGKYELQVECRQAAQTWLPISPTPNSFFSIPAPFYKTTWFLLTLITITITPIVLLMVKEWQTIRTISHIRLQIARDLHDDIGATLGSIGIYANTLKMRMEKNDLSSSDNKDLKIADSIVHAAEESGKHLRDIVWAIQPERKSTESLPVRFRKMVEECTQDTSINLAWDDTKGKDFPTLSPIQKRNIYLVLKEAFNNILRHAQAKNVWIIQESSAHRLRFVLRDDGKGFSIDELQHLNGLHNMKERMTELGGRLTLHSMPGKGTSVEVELVLS